MGLLLILAATKAPYWFAGALILVATVTPVYGAYIAFKGHLLLWDWSWPVFVSAIVGFHSIFNRFTKEFFEKQAIKKQFAGYASPTVVRMLQENPALIKDGMKKDISICFSDLRGFTPLGESFGDDVKGLTKLMNGYMDAITQPVLDKEGMIIKYIGDASMHVHGAPLDDPDHPKSAVQTGLDMLKAVEKFNEKITSEGRPPIGMGAGINTGIGYLGEMGSTARHSYDVLGDAVSTAARIESKCKEYGCVLLVGESTYQATKDDFFYLKIDDLQVKGKSVGLTIYTVLDDVGPAWKNAQKKHIQMHEDYRAQRFDEAIKKCKLLHDHFDHKMQGYYDMWIERCEFQKTQDLPKDWNGVFIATTK
jgi:adenylate cyclase